MNFDQHNNRQTFGDFEIVRELGRGGMGVVYEAQQKSLNRRVALKVLSSGLGLTTKAIMRFKREAEAAAKLHHTNIVPIYTTGEDNRVPYYAMELIEGPSLDQVIRFLQKDDANTASNTSHESAGNSTSDSGNQFPQWVVGTTGFGNESTNHRLIGPSVDDSTTSSFGSGTSYFDNIARMLAEVADSLAHAHDQGVIHRDIKPSNLLLAPDGRLSLNDFGLARMLEQPGMTISGEFMGSPMYMSPEQVTAGRIPLDHRTDIYSLGATLYELITLQHPFDGEHRDQVLSQIIHKEPVRPRRINKRIPQDLETICVKAMEKDPDRRYQTADVLAEDLRHFVDRNVISARRIGPIERAARWAKKNKLVTGMACLTFVAIVLTGLTVYLSSTRENKRIREQAMNDALISAMSGELKRAVVEIATARSHGADAAWELMLNGQVDMFHGNDEEGLIKLEAAVQQNPDSVMAKSMLATSYLWNGLWDQYVDTVHQLEELPEVTPEDHLFKGIAICVFAPKQSLLLIDKAIRLRPSFTVARIHRASVRTTHGLYAGRLSPVLDALSEVSYVARDVNESNPILKSIRLRAQLAVYSLLHRQEKKSEEANQYLLAARADAEDLVKNYPTFAVGSQDALHYYNFMSLSDLSESSELDAMNQVMATAAHANRSFVLTRYCATFFRAGNKRIAEALRQLDRLPDQDDPYMLWARIVLLSDTRSGREAAEKLCEDFLSRHPPNVDPGFPGDVWSLLLLGHEQKVIERAREQAKHVVTPKSWKVRASLWRYLGDEITQQAFVAKLVKEPELIEREKGWGYFAIGLRKLAQGSRQEALEMFRISANSTMFYWTSVKWSRAFVARMEQDPNWPEWLPNTNNDRSDSHYTQPSSVIGEPVNTTRKQS